MKKIPTSTSCGSRWDQVSPFLRIFSCASSASNTAICASRSSMGDMVVAGKERIEAGRVLTDARAHVTVSQLFCNLRPAMSSTKQKGTKKPKAVKSRPAAAGSALHAPADERAGDGRLCAFAPDGARLALVARAGAGERLRVFDALAGRAEAEMTLDGPARASCVAWVELDLDGAPAAEDAGRRKRRKRKSDADAMAVDESASTAAKQQLVALGRVDGSVVLFSPTHSRVLRTLTHAHASTAVLAVASASGSLPRIWTTSADGAIRLWDAARNALLGSWTAPGEATPFSALAPPGPHPDVLIAAHHGVRVFALPDAAADPDASATAVPVSGTLQALSSCTGHASPITALHWTNTPTPVLVSSAADDRSLSFWTLPAQGEGTLACTLSLDADIRAFALAPDGAHVLAVSAASVATIHALPPVAPTSKKLSTLPAASTVALGKQSGPTRAEIAAACFVPDQPGAVRVARLVGGVKPVFDLVVSPSSPSPSPCVLPTSLALPGPSGRVRRIDDTQG
jgi:U3 small nucleolar RNA-associated protein 5